MARRVLPSRLELNRPEGSSSAAPLAKVSFTLSRYVSPVHRIPACSHVGTPIGFDDLRHLTASITCPSAAWISARTRASVSPRQSPSASLFASINREGESAYASRSAIPAGPPFRHPPFSSEKRSVGQE